MILAEWEKVFNRLVPCLWILMIQWVTLLFIIISFLVRLFCYSTCCEACPDTQEDSEHKSQKSDLSLRVCLLKDWCWCRFKAHTTAVRQSYGLRDVTIKSNHLRPSLCRFSWKISELGVSNSLKLVKGDESSMSMRAAKIGGRRGG